MIFLPLSSQHDHDDFDCGDGELNRWLSQITQQHDARKPFSTFVATADSTSTEVLGYYAVSVTELVNTELPTRYRNRLPEKVPAFRLGRLAVSIRHKGQRIGESLLFDAIDRATRISKNVGGVEMVASAKPATIDFFRQYGFEQMADHPLNLFLMIQTSSKP
jgi:hypothetical protein